MTAAARLEQEEQELETYLRRVGFPPLPSGELSGGGAGLRHRPAPTVDTLRALHQCQGRNVPFENIDQHCGRRIVLDVDVIYHKVVQRRRGGFCFEVPVPPPPPNDAAALGGRPLLSPTPWGVAKTNCARLTDTRASFHNS
jgi:hypothetical protein